jgi:photosystem II stability/assembly factor-like uncharacterized protein
MTATPASSSVGKGLLRGIAFRPNNHLIVSSSASANAHAIPAFDTSGTFVGNFIGVASGGLQAPWGILYRQDDILVSGINTPQGVFRYDFNGASIGMLTSTANFPQQMYELENGIVAVANFSPPSGVRLHTSAGAEIRLLSGVTGNRGVWGLGNGNILTSNAGGFHEIDTATGALVRTIITGIGGRLFGFLPPQGASITLNAPNGGEMWEAGSVENITWSAPGVDSVRIEYTINDGGRWNMISAGVPASPGSYAWTVPDAPSTQVRVKVTSVSDPSLSATSTGMFTIHNPAAPLGWHQTPTGVTQGFDGLYVQDAFTAWASGNGGTIIKTTNGGVTWTVQPTPTTVYLYSIYFVDEETGWAAGSGTAPGVILKTTNGGQTWDQQFSAAGISFLHAIHFVNADTGVVAGTGGFLRTTNGGAAWTIVPRSGTIYQIEFVNSLVGWAVAEAGAILKTTDGGATWNAQTSGTTNVFHDLHAVNENVAWAVGQNTTVRRTTNGGATWTPVTIPITPATLWAWGVRFADEMTGWISGDQGWIIKTTDGGATWKRQPTTPGMAALPLYQIKLASDQIVWTAGEQGLVVRTVNGGEAPASAVAPASLAFGLVTIGNDSTRTFVVRNTGTMAMRIDSLNSTNPRFEVTGVSLPASVNAGDSLVVPVVFSPLDTTLQSGSVRVVTNDPYVPLRTVGVSGRGQTPVSVGPVRELPSTFALDQNHPNPFNPATSISYALPAESAVRLTVYSTLGQEVARLVDEVQSAGYHELVWDSRGIRATQSASGVYFLRMEAVPKDGSVPFIHVRKMVLLR